MKTWMTYFLGGQQECCPYKTIMDCRDAIFRVRFTQITITTLFGSATGSGAALKKRRDFPFETIGTKII